LASLFKKFEHILTGVISSNKKPEKLGIFGGVFTPDVLTILGVIMYLRLGWVVGNAGFLGAVVIIVLIIRSRMEGTITN